MIIDFFHSISCYTMGNKKEEHSSNQMVSSFSFATLTRARSTQIQYILKKYILKNKNKNLTIY